MWIGFVTSQAILFVQELIDPEVGPIAEDGGFERQTI